MGDAIGLTSIGSRGLSAGSDSIIYDALVNGIGKVVSYSYTGRENDISVPRENYNTMYYISTAHIKLNDNAATVTTATGWIYDFNAITQISDHVAVGHFKCNITSSQIEISSLHGNTVGSITLLLLTL